MALFGQDQVDPRIARGGIALGDVLGGGVEQRAQLNGAKYERQRYDAFGALEDARKKRSEAIIANLQAEARGGLGAAIAADPVLGGPRSALNQAMLGMATGQPNLNTQATGLRALGDIEIDRERQDAVKTGDIPKYNQLTALVKDLPYQPARVVAGNILPDGVALGDDDFSMVPLPQTLATIEKQEALGAAATTRANRAPAQRAPRVATTAGAEASELSQARAAVQAGADPAAVADMLRKRGYPGLAAKVAGK